MRPLALKRPLLRGEDVREVQRLLGFRGRALDGVYGPDTAARVEEWKWRTGYPRNRIDNVLGLYGQGLLKGSIPFPADFERRASERKGIPWPTAKGVVRPLATDPGRFSEFRIPDPEGAPANDGRRYHAGKDWFARSGSPVRAPVDGTVVEARMGRRSTGQRFGGTVKIRDAFGRVWVFRHVDPKGVTVGQTVEQAHVVATVSRWRDGKSHAHIELWKTLEGGYDFENMLDPMRFFR